MNYVVLNHPTAPVYRATINLKPVVQKVKEVKNQKIINYFLILEAYMLLWGMLANLH